MNNKLALASLAMDLKRTATGYHRGSVKTGERFFREALQRKEEIDIENVKPYLQKLLKQLSTIDFEEEKEKVAEKALTYSILFQNAALKIT